MKTYRIKHCKQFSCDYYIIERKSLFGFWFKSFIEYNSFDSIEDAEDTIKQLLFGTKTTILKEYSNDLFI